MFSLFAVRSRSQELCITSMAKVGPPDHDIAILRRISLTVLALTRLSAGLMEQTLLVDPG